jgi:hypothetical protein
MLADILGMEEKLYESASQRHYGEVYEYNRLTSREGSSSDRNQPTKRRRSNSKSAEHRQREKQHVPN